MLFSLALSIQSFFEFGYRQSQTFEQACLWWKIDFIWPINPFLFVYFVIHYTKRTHMIKSPLIKGLVAAPCIAGMVLEITTDLITGPPVKSHWGWWYGPPSNEWIGAIFYIWIFGSYIASFLLLAQYTRTQIHRRTRIQAFILAACSFICTLAIIIENVLNILSVSFPQIVVPSMIFLNVCTGFAIWKYEMFPISPKTASEEIIATMTEAMFLIGPEGALYIPTTLPGNSWDTRHDNSKQ